MAKQKANSSQLNLDLVEATMHSSSFTTTTTSTYQDTGFSITLPSPGKWLLLGEMRIALNANEYGEYQYYNTTTSTIITDSDRIAILGPSGGQATTPLNATVTTTTANNVIRVNMRPGGAYAVSLISDTNGKTKITALRIG